MQWIIQIPVLFFSIIVHEFTHGYIAHKKGDDTAYLSGRLTFNPLPHIDLTGTVLIPAMCIMSGMPVFGWAKPVPVNPLRLRRPRKDMALVALSGPASNIAIAFFSLVMFKIVSLSGLASVDLTNTFLMLFRFAVIINLALAFFNLIPVFPLDGSQILLGTLPDKWLDVYEKHIPYGMYIILFLMISGILKMLVLPPMIFALTIFSKMGFGLM
ncbi:MAG: site-2 protease family protein [Elusimicrobia bacterium]|nr:site-2 protease family protein [Elusimicrobiota bacterium]